MLFRLRLTGRASAGTGKAPTEALWLGPPTLRTTSAHAGDPLRQQTDGAGASFSGFDKRPHRTARLGRRQQAAELSSASPAPYAITARPCARHVTPFAGTSEQKARPGNGGGPGHEQKSHPIRAVPALPLIYLLARSGPEATCNCDSNLSQIICALAARLVRQATPLFGNFDRYSRRIAACGVTTR